MRKLTALILAAVMVMTVLCGCNILEAGTPPTLPKLSYDESALTGKVEFVNGRTCRISILEGDGHYDAATENRDADVIYVTFSYAYTTDVTERDGEPHISVRNLNVR